MPEPPDDLTLRQSLRDGLHALPVPSIAPDFDARVLDALRAPLPWWRRVWEPARPLLLGASCSLSVTLVLLHWTLAAPRPPILAQLHPTGGHEQESVQAGVQSRGRAPSLDRLLDRPDLRAGSLAAAWATRPPDPPDRRPTPPRHALAGHCACLVV